MINISTSNTRVSTPTGRSIDPFYCHDRALRLRTVYIRYVARIISRKVRQGLASRIAVLFGLSATRRQYTAQPPSPSASS